ncbi:hypothetical protein OM076_14880 [Solirubrobacter ginsenosidimutans]|uniref:SDR family NAD(P)-dependent oxidoreductase n=1 Tax=Solirubrobacter ginsenosidimutans TaxID=490573 RepID=A0A9X3MS33_9ACTN|nr:hypothetical protein [Solirubrobacter ginsenosidimutans]MDA0161559.1 hypothetical protein [Solirubrobacter ginsenosidimutans]
MGRHVTLGGEMVRSFVVTGGTRGVGRAIAERLRAEGRVVVVDLAGGDVVGDASDDAVLERAVALASEGGATLSGWVNNAAVFRDAALHEVPSEALVALVAAHLLSPAASFVNGAVVPVDGGRAALGIDPEATNVV